MLAFGPDGYLYIGMGDGGSAGDPGNRAQNLNSLLGKILRIDIDTRRKRVRDPADEPVRRHDAGHDQIWSCGLRNPWRFSFDGRPATCGSATSARTATRRSTARQAPERRPRRELRLAGPRGQRLLQPADRLQHGRQDDADRGLRPQPRLLGDRRLRLSRHDATRISSGVYLFGDFCSGRIWGARRRRARTPRRRSCSTTRRA